MAKKTLLEVVQAYLDTTDGDQVNSINDTIESQQVAAIAEQVFDNVIGAIRDWKFTQKVRLLEAVSDNTKPNYLKIPDIVTDLKDNNLYYNRTTTAEPTAVDYQRVEYLEPGEFQALMNCRSTATPNSQVVTGFNSVKFVVINNKHPDYYTSIDDSYVVFDSFDNTVDSTLQASKSQVLTNESKTFTRTDAYVIDLPETFQHIYQAGVNAKASETLRQEPIFSDARLFRVELQKEKVKHSRTGSDRNNAKAQKSRNYRRG